MSSPPIKKTYLFIAAVFFVGLLLRLVLIPNPGFEADVSFWKSWGLATYDYGIVEGLKVSNNNYPTPFAYVLGVMVWLYSLLADPHNFNEFWRNTNVLFLTAAKLFPVVADFAIAGFLIWIGTKTKKFGFPNLPISLCFALSALYLLNPVSLADGAWWGQVDSVGVLMFLLAFGAAISKRPFWAGLIYIAAVMTKLQNMIYGPLFFLLIWQLTGYAGMVKALWGATVAFFGLNIEFLLTREMGRVIDSLTTNYDYFPLLSLNAYNLWWIVAAGGGMQVSDKIATIGITNAKTMGLLFFSGFYLFAILRQIMVAWSHGYTIILNKKSMHQRINAAMEEEPKIQIKLRTFLENLIIVNASFFLFQTQSHDRYLFPTIVFLLLWGLFYLSHAQPANKQVVTSASRTDRLLNGYLVKNKKFRVFFLFYVLFSLLYFYNLHTALVINYPHNGLPLLSRLTQPVFTISTAFIFFLFFIFFLVKNLIKTRPLVYCLPLAFIFLALAAINRPLWQKQPVGLSNLAPIISSQEFGQRSKNMAVNSSFGIGSWTRLSGQYAFYRLGIGTHTNSQLVYDINRQFKRLTTDFGIDTEAGLRGSAVFEIYGDGKLLFRSAKMGRFDLPRHAQVNITGVKLLGLVTTDAGDGNTDDHTDWLRPTLWP